MPKMFNTKRLTPQQQKPTNVGVKRNDEFTALRLPKDLKAWAATQAGTLSEVIRGALYAAMMREVKHKKGGK
jgi:hypothetical protein